MLFYECVLILSFLWSTQVCASAGRRKGNLRLPPELEHWTGRVFPFDSTTPTTTTATTPTTTTTTTTPTTSSRNEFDDWKGRWFPFPPGSPLFKELEPICDDGEYSINIDFDPEDKRHAFNYLCMSKNQEIYKPDLNLEALKIEHVIPPQYVPPVRCINENITYDEPLPTFGAFRPLPPKYGTYRYLPPQRWLRSVAEGAIVMLYHPCAFPGQVKILKDILKSCIYRHVITPTQSISAERPLALIAWGKILRMSVVDEKIAVNFIKDYAKQGPMSLLENRKEYDKGLLAESKLITDIDDTEICGFKEM